MILYKSHNGKEVTAHSYSAGLDFKCPKKYYYKKVMGWISRDDRSNLEFGKCIESAIQFHAMNGREDGLGVLEFKRLWNFWQLDSSLQYSASDGDWETLYKVGSELMRLYEAKLPFLPIQNETYQVNYKKELFPDTEYAGLEWQGFLDVISEVDASHPFLPPLKEIPENGKRKVILDIKTAAKAYPESNPRIYQLDGQLRQYAWATGIETVAFLVLVKNGSKVGSGDQVSCFLDGKDYYVLTTYDDHAILIQDEWIYDEYQAKVKEIKGKGSQAAKEDLLAKYVLTCGKKVPLDQLTKQRIQFLCAVIPPEDQAEAGEQIGKEAVEIAQAHEMNYYPKCPGVRFPNQVCTTCEMLGHCIGDKNLVKQRLVQIGGDF